MRRVRLPVPPGEALAWHARPGAFDRLTPPWQRLDVVARDAGIAPGTRVTLRVGPFRQRWRLEHRDVAPALGFRDVQLDGPFAHWDHRHTFAPDGAEGTLLEDRIDYALPLGPLGRAAAGASTRDLLRRLFDYRHRVTADDLAMHARVAAARPLRILVSGASGLIGRALLPVLTTGGHVVTTLVRRAARGPHEHAWDPVRGTIDAAALEGVDAVVHLAGENLAGARWSPSFKARILDSRVRSTRLLCEALARSARPPRVIVTSSAIGRYGNRGEELLDETSAPGTGFLPDVVRAWEGATAAAEAAGIRVVHVRTAMVLTPAGGALAPLLPLFGTGLGGPLGDGRAWWSWIAMDDLIEVFHAALTRDELGGAVHACAPGTVRNAEFARTLGRVLGRPAFLPAPAPVLRGVLGEMADAMLLSSARATPERLERLGHRFRFPALEGALRHVLGRTAAGRERA